MVAASGGTSRECYTYEAVRRTVRFVKEHPVTGERTSGRVVIRYLRLTARPGAVLLQGERLLVTCTVRRGTYHYTLSSAGADWEPAVKLESMDRPRLNRWLRNNVHPTEYWRAVQALENA